MRLELNTSEKVAWVICGGFWLAVLMYLLLDAMGITP